MKRGDLITIAIAGDFGKPRPAVVVQTDLVSFTDTVIICMITSDLADRSPFRVDVSPTPQTGLKKPSQIMADKAYAVLRTKCGPVFGHVPAGALAQLQTALVFILGFEG